MRQDIFVLANKDILADKRFDKAFASIGEYISEVSHLLTALEERAVNLILIPENFPGINTGIIRRLRMRAPMADIWKIGMSRFSHLEEDSEYDGMVNLSDGSSQISKKIKKILYQKELLKKFGMIGRSEKMKIIAETIDRIAPTDISVLLIGPSGSGKELVARATHDNSARSDGRFVAVNCGALAEGILESELFGHEKGAFTGSVGKREGLFVQADKGTIFLDEIAETKPDIQVKLLRVLEDGYFYPVGGDKPSRSDARVIAATNRDLSEAIRDGQFREDLYFRLSVVKIILPPLYERKADILPLLCHFASREGIKGFTDSAMDILLRYDWPGNVRQLRNFISSMAIMHPDQKISAETVERFISEQSLRQKNLPVPTGHTTEEAGHELIYHALISLGNEVRMLRDLITANLPSQNNFEAETEYDVDQEAFPGKTLKDMERSMIQKTLEETGGNRKETAELLGIGERTLYRKIKEYGLS